MLRFVIKIINSSVLKRVSLPPVLRFKKKVNMSDETPKINAEPNSELVLPKKIKLEQTSDLENITKADSPSRTVATMCGAWRRDEVDGGLIFVFKKRDPGLSPEPVNVEDYPENVEDFWEGQDSVKEEIKVMSA